MSEFTNHHKKIISQIDSENFEYEEMLDFLRNPDNFRPFSEGLIQLLEETIPSIPFDDKKKKIEYLAKYLYERLHSIDPTIPESRITAWFEGKHSPKLTSNSRKLMYKICFALKLPLKKVVWFFGHVYFERSFNFHMIDESVYYYCFKYNKDYFIAESLIKEIMEKPEKPSKNYILSYTQKIREEIDKFSSTDTQKLVDYLSDYKFMFQKKWNLSAKDSINEHLESLLGREESKQIIENFKKKGFIPSDAIENCGLIIQVFYKHFRNGLLEYISGKNILSIDFMLTMILDTTFGIQKTAAIPDIVKNNFPSKKVFSDILSGNKSNTSTSYDSIKKVLIFLKFHDFWYKVELKKYSEFTQEQLYDIFIDETNHLLFDCGYEDLYEGNPYDWIFMCCSKTAKPLDCFSSFVHSLIDTEEDD